MTLAPGPYTPAQVLGSEKRTGAEYLQIGRAVPAGFTGGYCVVADDLARDYLMTTAIA